MTALAQIGQYRVLRKLGRTHVGVLYLAHDDNRECDVVLKFLAEVDNPSHDVLFESFKCEAKLLSRLIHPNVVCLLDLSECDRIPFLVLEANGLRSLEDAIKQGIDAKDALPALIEVLHGLAYIHEQGIVHCDIKPANIFVQEEGPAKIMNFEVARFFTDEPPFKCGGVRIGASGYMSPEQARGDKLDGRSDLFSVGCIVCELLAGKPSSYEWESLWQVAMRAVKERPQDRYRDAAEMSGELSRALSELGGSKGQLVSEMKRPSEDTLTNEQRERVSDQEGVRDALHKASLSDLRDFAVEDYLETLRRLENVRTAVREMPTDERPTERTNDSKGLFRMSHCSCNCKGVTERDMEKQRVVMRCPECGLIRDIWRGPERLQAGMYCRWCGLEDPTVQDGLCADPACHPRRRRKAR